MKIAVTDQKMRGGYYTPPEIAKFLASWVVVDSSDTVLEPSCGDGNLAVAVACELLERGASASEVIQQITAVELDAAEACKARVRLSDAMNADAQTAVHTEDFFTFCSKRVANGLFSVAERFDAILGNPPFIRYQNFPEEHRVAAFKIMQQVGLTPTKLTNTWASFLVSASLLLETRGRLAMVIPAELFQVGYAAEIRRFLIEHFRRITLVTFRRLVFPDIQQEVVLLLGERDNAGPEGVRVVELTDATELSTLPTDSFLSLPLKQMDHSSEKWTQYYLESEEIELIRKLRSNPLLARTGDVLEVDVGVVTGENKFFVLSDEQASHLELAEYVRPIVTRSSHLAGIEFAHKDRHENAQRGYSVHLLNVPNVALDDLPSPVSTYIKRGEGENVHAGYKCRIRKRWYTVPSVWEPDAFLLRQVHGYPKLIINKANATSTDTIHRVRFKKSKDLAPDLIATAFLNSVTFAFSELMGRSYGGGVLTFEPSECEQLPLPLSGAAKLDASQVDALVREGNITAVLDMNDAVLLGNGLGLNAKEMRMLRGIWEKMRDRRIGRRK